MLMVGLLFEPEVKTMTRKIKKHMYDADSTISSAIQSRGVILKKFDSGSSIVLCSVLLLISKLLNIDIR